jgi:Carboxypeptidase regulatory-like domain
MGGDSMRNFRFLSVLLLAFVVFPIASPAQSVASITGVVTDTTGAAVPGASIKIVDTRTGETHFAKTAGDGSYRIVDLKPGPGYALTVRKDGFATSTISGIYLPVATAATRDVKLELGSINQQIEVTAESAGTINTTDASIGNVVEGQQVEDLPSLFRDDASHLLELAPGVQVSGGDSQNGSVTGERADQMTVTLDGLDVNDETIGSPFTAVGRAPIDSVLEFRNIVGNPDATFGRSSGAQVALVTKSGTNQFHGSLNEFNRVSLLAANNFFNNLAGIPRGQLTRNQFGGDLGGPILKNKLFFFFDYEGRRDAEGLSQNLTVPLPAFLAGQLSYINSAGAISTLPALGAPGSQSVQGLDPQDIGADAAFLSFVKSRYPEPPNNAGVGDGINTGGFQFTAPDHVKENTFVGRLDYNLSSKHTLFARGTWDRDNDTQVPKVFPQDTGDQVSFIGHERSWVVGDTWIISPAMTNQAFFGLTRQVNAFPVNFAPTAPTDFSFDILSNPFGDVRGQSRNVPVPELHDVFTWQKGTHTMQFGTDIKWIRVHSSNINDIDFQDIGLQSFITSLDSTLRPADILSDPTNPETAAADSLWDNAFTTILGRYASTTAQYNYDVAGSPFPQFTASIRDFHYDEYELFAQDTWKITPDLTITYGLRWNYDAVPYESGGFESVPTLFVSGLFSARQAAALAGVNGDSAAPFVSYTLGGPVNHGPNYYKPDYRDFSPRIGIAYSPSFTEGFWGRLLGDRKTSIRAGGEIAYDRLLSTLQFEIDEASQLFDSSQTFQYGVSNDPTASLLTDPRFTSLSTPPPVPLPGTIPRPSVTPFVSGGVGFGLLENQSLFQLNNVLKSPYSINASFGIQRELPGSVVFEADYFGRFGRRLVGVGDPAQQVNFKDATSGQFLNTAFGNVQKQLQSGVAPNAVAAQSWFENQIGAQLAGSPFTCPTVAPLFHLSVAVSNCTQLAASLLPNNFITGDLSTVDVELNVAGLIAPNTGLFSQTGSVASVGNFAASSYNSLVLSARKRISNNLQFDFDYTYAHSIDNVSDITNDVIFAQFNSQGLICDLRNLRVCRASSDFDATHTVSVNYEYQLPFGRGQHFFGSSSRLLDALVGGWATSGIVQYHTGFPWTAITNAFPINFTQQASAVLVGPSSAVRHGIHAVGGALQLFADPAAADGAFAFPFGGGTGERNVLRGPGFSNVDMAILKNFTMPWSDNQRLQFRVEAFNVFNHPSFNNPSVNPAIPTGSSDTTNNNIENGPSQFGNLTNMSNAPREFQFGLRYEF